MNDSSGGETRNKITGGTYQGSVLQAHTISEVNFLSGAPAPLPAPAQLPPRISAFTGRNDELEVIINLLDPAKDADNVMLLAVAGLPGVGKTSLAVQAGHLAREKGWLDGGIIFVDLHGYDDIPVSSTEALDMLLRALEVSVARIPQTLDERAALYRSKLSEISRPVLVIADNASSEAQVQPLLPGSGPHKVIITSRHTLAGLGARLLDLTVLDEKSGLALLDKTLRDGRPNDDRISHNPSAKRLARICGGLPLALQIAAAILKSDAMLRADMLADELEASQSRLAALEYGDDTGRENARSVEAAFSLSYKRLNETSARVFRLISVNPDDDVSTATASVLVDLAADATRKVLRGLARAHLIEAVPGLEDRWRMHDLVRLYAQRLSVENATVDHRDQAIQRLLRYGSKTQVAATELERVTVNLTRRSARALALAAELSGESRTDAINRAIQLYAFLEQIDIKGGTIYVKESESSEAREVKFL